MGLDVTPIGHLHKLFYTLPKSLALEDIPFSLKRNEKVYFIAGQHSVEDFTIAFVLTDSRLFFVKPQYAFQVHTGKISRLSITPGIKPVSLSSIIAIDVPSCVPEFSVNNVKVKFVYRKIVTAPKIPLLLPESARSIRVHFNNGKDVLLPFEEGLEADLCHSLLKEMVDRINDPIDDSVFSPKRERMADDIKVAVWRRDGARVYAAAAERDWNTII